MMSNTSEFLVCAVQCSDKQTKLTTALCVTYIDQPSSNGARSNWASGLCRACNFWVFCKSTKCCRAITRNIIFFYSCFFLDIFVETLELKTQTFRSHLHITNKILTKVKKTGNCLKPNCELFWENRLYTNIKVRYIHN